jgi:hypothetical protein
LSNNAFAASIDGRHRRDLGECRVHRVGPVVDAEGGHPGLQAAGGVPEEVGAPEHHVAVGAPALPDALVDLVHDQGVRAVGLVDDLADLVQRPDGHLAGAERGTLPASSRRR